MKWNRIFWLPLVFLLSSGSVRGQECGPGCPACSGKAIGDLISPTTIVGSVLYLPDSRDETSVVNVRYGLFSWMDAGIGYAVEAERLIWSVRFQPFAQDFEGWRPALILGTGSVQVGESDQSVFLQIAKTIEIIEGRLSFSVAGGYATDFPDWKETWGLGTFSVTLFDRIRPFYLYDGIHSHGGLSYFAADWLTFTGYWLELDAPAVSVHLQWTLGAKHED